MGSDGRLRLDGTVCGGVNPASVTIFDFSPSATQKTLVLDGSRSWGVTFVNLLLDIDVPDSDGIVPTYMIRVIGSAGDDTVAVTDSIGGFIQILDNGTPHLTAGLIDDPISLDVSLGDGDDTFSVTNDGGPNIVSFDVLGGPGNDTISGSNLDDRLRGGKGDDDIRGRGGDDIIRGQSGQDTLRGGPGADDVRGGTAIDRVFGNSGADTLYGNSNDDIIRGGSGADFIHGGKGEDDVKGNGGNDTFDMDDGRVDRVSGGPGANDTCDECDAIDRVTASVENQ